MSHSIWSKSNQRGLDSGIINWLPDWIGSITPDSAGIFLVNNWLRFLGNRTSSSINFRVNKRVVSIIFSFTLSSLSICKRHFGSPSGTSSRQIQAPLQPSLDNTLQSLRINNCGISQDDASGYSHFWNSDPKRISRRLRFSKS